MAKERRRSVYTDKFSTRNPGDQPLSPPTDTSLIISTQPNNTPQVDPRQLARNIAFSFSDESVNSSRISNGTSELQVSWNYHEGRKPIEPTAHEPQENVPVTPIDTRGHSATTLQVDEGSGTRSQPTYVQARIGQKAASLTKLQMTWAVLSIVTTLGYLLVLTERLGLAQPALLQRVGSFSILFSGLPGFCLVCMCYMGAVYPLKRESNSAGSSSVSSHDTSAFDPLAKTGKEESFVASEAFHELRIKAYSNVLKTLFGFVLWDLVRAYASFWPMLYLPMSATHVTLQEPPFFGQSPEGAKVGIHGYPPRTASGHVISLALSPLSQLVFPLIADCTRLVGLWFALKAMRHIQSRGKPESNPAYKQKWISGSSDALFLGLFALPLSFLLLHQSFWGSACMQPFPGLMPLVGNQASAFAELLLRCHSVFLGLAAAFTGSILAAAFDGLFRTNAKNISAVLAAVASLAFCGCIIFDVLAAAVPSSGISCTYTPFTADMQSGFVGVKAFAMAATLSHQVGQICLSLSAATVKLRDALEATADPQEKEKADASR